MTGQGSPLATRVVRNLLLTVVVLLVLVAVANLVMERGRATPQDSGGVLAPGSNEAGDAGARKTQALLEHLLRGAGRCVTGERLVIEQRPSGLFVAYCEQGVRP